MPYPSNSAIGLAQVENSTVSLRATLNFTLTDIFIYATWCRSDKQLENMTASSLKVEETPHNHGYSHQFLSDQTIDPKP